MRFPSRHPFVFGVGLTALKTGGADLFVQNYVERCETPDLRRTAVFLTFGVFYLGTVRYGTV